MKHDGKGIDGSLGSVCSRLFNCVEHFKCRNSLSPPVSLLLYSPPCPTEEGSDGLALVASGVQPGPAQLNPGGSLSMGSTNGHSAWEAPGDIPYF